MSMEHTPAPGIAHAVQVQAAEWLVELQSDDLDTAARGRLLARLQAWRAADAQHERAWQRIEAMGQRLQPLAGTPASRALAQAARAARPGDRRRALGQLALLLFVGGTAGAVAWRASGDGAGDWLVGLGADLHTGTAERRSLQLPDGSHLQLNARSAIDLDYGPQARVLRLRAGEILVDASSAASPFVVETRHGRVRALGTRFAVRQRAAQPTRVAVFEGATALAPRAGPALTLQAGQQARFDDLAVEAPGVATPGQAAWARGMLVAFDMPLADFLAELAQYRPGRLACDPAVATLRVSGTYPLNDAADTERALSMLAASLPLRLRQASRYWVTVVAR